ncbi:hypothetical protein V8G54_030196 [Vigna mungo]|uniref:Bifunctional inhibitor/plant lipid transfer protein/seed storage helical domain-containing protein n=1 Tax=Vigna mungo TaxID=3915 RepID=A0AAQ3MVQ4_VIGMU
MKRIKIFNLTAMAMTFLAIVPKMVSQTLPTPFLHPLCLSQLTLANYACAMLPLTAAPPVPPPPPPPSPGDHGFRGRSTLQEEDCCRWAKEIDNQCVCEVLVLLPPFLTKPLHQYAISIGESCNVTYSCAGTI